MGSPEDRVIHEPREDATPERQRRALAGLYAHVIDLTGRTSERTSEATPNTVDGGKGKGPRRRPR